MLTCFFLFSKALSYSIVIDEIGDPIYTSSLFDISLSLYDPSLSVLGFNISAILFDSESGTESLFVGKNSCQTNLDGSCVLESLLIEFAGFYYFVFTSGEVQVESEEFEVYEGFSSIVVNSSAYQISAFAAVTLKIFVLDANGELWVEDWVEYTISSSGLFFNDNSGILGYCVDGFDSVSTFIAVPGLYSISVSSGTLNSEKIQLEVLKNRLKFIEVSSTEMFIESDFNIKIGIYDDQFENLAINDQFTYVNLYLNSEELSLNSSVQVKNGVATFKNLKIPKAGKYQISAESIDRPSIQFESLLLVKNFPLGSIIIHVPDNLTAFFQFPVNFDLLNTAGKPFTEPCKIDLSSNATLSGNTQVTTTNGSGTLDLYIKEIGNVTLLVYSNFSVTNSSDVFINSPVLQIDPQAFINNESNYFNVNVTVLDFSTRLKNLTENCLISLSLTPKGTLFGEIELETLNGATLFKNLSILTQGKYNFQASLRSLQSADTISIGTTTQKFEISDKQIYLPKELQVLTRVLALSNNKTVNAYFDFPLKVNLIDQIGNNFKQDCEVGVIGNNTIYGDTYATVTSGELIFNLYTKDPGDMKIIITTCNDMSNKTELTVLPLSASIQVQELMQYGVKKFNISVNVMDYEGIQIESKNGLYGIELTTSPSSNFSSPSTVSQVKGSYTFYNITVDPAGNYSFNAFISESNSDLGLKVSSNLYSVPMINIEPSNYPMITFICLFWLMGIFSIVFYINDRHYLPSVDEKNSVIKYYGVLVFNSPGQNHIRIVSLLRIFMGLYLMFTLLGFDYCNNIFNKTLNEDFSLETIWKSILVLIINQGVILPLILIHFLNLENASACKFVGGLSGLVISSCICFTIWLLIKCDPKYFSNWVLTFLFFTCLDLIVFQNIYGLVFSVCLKKSNRQELALIQNKRSPLLSPRLNINSPKGVQVRPSLTPNFLKSASPKFEYIKRSTITPSVKKFFVFDEKSVLASINSFKERSSISTEPTLPKSPKIQFLKRVN